MALAANIAVEQGVVVAAIMGGGNFFKVGINKCTSKKL